MAAIASAQTMGQGERRYSDHVAVEAMRRALESVGIDGTMVIGEGERDEAPMLDSDRERCERLGISDLDRVFYTRDLAPGKDIGFPCAGVTDGNPLRGVRFFGYGGRSHCAAMTTRPHQVRFIEAIHACESTATRFRF